MKKIRQILVLLTVALFTVTCKKEHVPVSASGTPEFYFNGAVNGITTSLNAGINNYYMYSSYIQDSNSVYNFIGNLKQTTSNLSGIEVEINDYKVSAVNANTNPDSSLKTGNYLYYSVGVNDTAYNVQFTSSYSGGTAQTYTWTFGDGSISNNANPLHTYANMGVYNVCVTIAGTAGVSNVCNNINLSSPSVIARKTTVSTTASGNTIYFNASTSGFIPSKYTWDFGDSTGSSANSDSTINNAIHTYTTSGLYHIRLSVKDSSNNTGDSIIVTYFNAATSTYVAAVANFNVGSVTKVITTGTSLRLGDVTVKWTDAAGVTYSSNNNAAQPASSYFKILSEEAYQNNINGQLTRKLHIQFTCTLYCIGHNPIQITNADAVIAAAYK
jgi:PKD repeat protein